jgi:site-specific DNA-methyltransferase (adenine-specific)/adenine-specific DNA-methyltransferase
MAELIANNRMLWPKKPTGRPRLKRYITDMKSDTTGFSTILDAPGNVSATKELADVLGPKVFAFPKPVGLIKQLVEQVTDKDSLILDSFAGSGTTAHAVMEVNQDDGGRRRFILVEMDETISRTVTAIRLQRVCSGYETQTGKTIKGLGGAFRYCQLGDPLFDEHGQIRSTVRFADLARHVYFTETGEPLPRERVTKSPLIAVCKGVAVYLLFNGILGDDTKNGGNVLTRAVLARLPAFDGPKVIYGAGCLLGVDRLRAERITFRQTPYEVKVT